MMIAKKKFRLICGSALLLFSNMVGAQDYTSKLMPQDSTLIYINGEGTFLHLGKKDGATFNLASTIQSGYELNRLDSTNGVSHSNRLSLNLVRMSFTASGLRDKVSMGLVTDFTGVSGILEGWLGFSVLNNHGKLILGQKQTNTNNRLAMADEKYSQVMSQSISGTSNDGIVYGGLMQNFVGSTREGGLFFETNFNINKWRIYPSVSMTTGKGQNFFTSQSGPGFKYGGRIDVMPFGDFIKNGAFIAHDLYREPKPKFAIGFAASYNVKANSPIGSANGIITTIYNTAGVQDWANYRKVVADFIYKYNGFSLVGEYTNATVGGKNLFINTTATKQLTPAVASNFYNLGNAYNLQGSYITKKGWAIDGRYTYVTPEFYQTGSLVHRQNWYTVGINKYLSGNALKIGINSTYIEDATPTLTTFKWITNLAAQLIF
jgi:hypothetical protein